MLSIFRNHASKLGPCPYTLRYRLDYESPGIQLRTTAKLAALE